MLEERVKEQQTEIQLKPRPLVIPIDNNGFWHFAFELPSIEELFEMRNLAHRKVALEDLVFHYSKATEVTARHILNQRLKNKSRHQESTTFFNRTAILSEIVGDLETAKKLLEEGIKTDNSSFLKIRLGALDARHSNMDKAIEAFLSINSDTDAFINLNLAHAYACKGEIDNAIKYSKKCLSINSLEFRARTLLGSLYLLKGEHRSAISEFRIASVDDPTNRSIHHNMALAYLLLKNPRKATESIKKAVAINPLNEDSVLLCSELLKRNGEYQQAQRTLEGFLLYENRCLKAWEQLAHIYFLEESFGKCLEALRHCVSLNENSRIFNNLAVVLLKSGDRKRAYQYFAQALLKMEQEDKINLILINNFVRTLNSDKEYQKAKAIADSAFKNFSLNSVTEDPHLADLYMNRLLSTSEINPQSVNVSEVDQLISKPLKNTRLQIDLAVFGSFHYSMIKKEEAKALNYAKKIGELLERNEGLDNDDKSLLANNAVFIYLELNQIEKARNLMVHLTPFVKKKAIPTATLGLYHFRNKNIERAQELYSKAISLTDSREVKDRIRQKLYLELSRYFADINDLKKAKSYYSKCSKIKDAKGVFNDDLILLKKKIG